MTSPGAIAQKSRKAVLKRFAALGLYPRGESNPNRWNRNPIFYPLNYGDFHRFHLKPWQK